MRVILSIIVLVSTTHALERPTGSVRGIIFDPPGRKGIAHALVSVDGTQRRSLTDEAGHFQIDDVPTGKHWLEVLSPGMTETTFPFSVAPSDTTTIRPLYLRFLGMSDDQAAAESIGVDVPWGAQALTCEIRPVRKVFHVGDHPEFEVTITNHGNGSLNLVYALDGSQRGRFPRATIVIAALDGGSLRGKALLSCGNTNDLFVDDFVLVEPGQTFDPYGIPMVVSETFERPGKYRAVFSYSTDQTDVRGWLGFGQKDLDPRMSRLFRRVPVVQLTATTEFTVAGSPPQIEGIQDRTDSVPINAVPPSAPITPRRPRRRSPRRRGMRPRGLASPGITCWRSSPY